MRNPIPATRRQIRREHRRLCRMIGRLRRREGTVSFHAEQGGRFAPAASAMAADLGCILADHLTPAADALQKAAANEEPLPESEVLA